MRRFEWLRRDIVLLLHAEGIAQHGGLAGLRDDGLLASALARPENLHAYSEEDDPFRLAAACAYGIARNHPFMDGNKRAAFTTAVTFLEFAGIATSLAEGEAVAATLDLAAGDLSEEGFAAWLRDNTTPAQG